MGATGGIFDIFQNGHIFFEILIFLNISLIRAGAGGQKSVKPNPTCDITGHIRMGL
jgi:hypothetical protein